MTLSWRETLIIAATAGFAAGLVSWLAEYLGWDGHLKSALVVGIGYGVAISLQKRIGR